jgi:hypothetical protein
MKDRWLKKRRENRFPKSVEKKENFRLDGVSSLEGGLVTLFIFFAVMICLTWITFCLECRYIIWENLRIGYKRVSNVLKTLRQKKAIKFRRHRKIHAEIGMIKVKPK